MRPKLMAILAPQKDGSLDEALWGDTMHLTYDYGPHGRTTVNVEPTVGTLAVWALLWLVDAPSAWDLRWAALKWRLPR